MKGKVYAISLVFQSIIMKKAAPMERGLSGGDE